MATHHRQPLGSHDHSVREKGVANNYSQVMTQQHRKGLLGAMARHQIGKDTHTLSLFFFSSSSSSSWHEAMETMALLSSFEHRLVVLFV